MSIISLAYYTECWYRHIISMVTGILSRMLTFAVQQKRRRRRRGLDVGGNGTVQRRMTNVLNMQIWSDRTGKYYPTQWRVKWHNSPASIQIHPQMVCRGCSFFIPGVYVCVCVWDDHTWWTIYDVWMCEAPPTRSHFPQSLLFKEHPLCFFNLYDL